MKKIIIMTILGLTTALSFFGCSTNYVDQRDRSAHFVDGTFRNANHQEKNWTEALKMWWQTPQAEWPKWVETDYSPAPQARVEDDQLRVTVINHATVLIQGGGYNVLTDPVYSKRVSPVSFAGPARVRNPAIRFEDLPRIDAVVISHDHYDHLDLATLKQLVERDNPQIYVGLGVGKRLDSMQNVTEMDWWESADVGKGFRLSFVPVQHFSGRWLTDQSTTLWGGFVLELAGKKVYFGGDSGYADHYKQTFDKFGAMDVALLPVGAYTPRWFMGYIHMDPKQAVQAHLDLQAKQSIGIHYGTFQLTAEPINEPAELLSAERSKAGLAEHAFITAEFGEQIVF